MYRALQHCVFWVTYTFLKSSERIRVWIERGSEFGGLGWKGLNREGSELGEGLSWGVWIGRVWVVQRSGLGGSESERIWLEGVRIGRSLNWRGLNWSGLSWEGVSWLVWEILHKIFSCIKLLWGVLYRVLATSCWCSLYFFQFM